MAVQGGKYKRVATPALGGWNPQEDDTSEERGEFFAVTNLRQVHKGQYEVRSGYKPTLVTATADTVVYSKAEYNVHDTSFDVTLYYHNTDQKVYALFYNKTTELIEETVTVASGLATAPEHVCGMQFQSFFYVSVYEEGLFAIFPEDDTFANWVIVETGKDLACTPNFALNFTRDAAMTVKGETNFANDTTGDIIVRSAVNDNNKAKYSYVSGEPEPTLIRIACNAKYWLVGGTKKATFDSAKLKLFDWNIHDDPLATLEESNSFGHLRTNGWGYKSVFIYEMTNTDGEKITWRSAPSVDWWVPNMTYVPAYLMLSVPGSVSIVNNMAGDGSGNRWRDPTVPPVWRAFSAGGANGDVTYIPSATDIKDLQSVWRKYFHADSASNDEGGTTDPFYFVSKYLGWATGNIAPANPYPYQIPVSAYDLKSAPMSRIKWDDFSKIPTSPTNYTPIPNPEFVDVDTSFPNIKVIGIEIYRTLFNQFSKDEGKTAAQSNLYRYGYVTTLQKDQEFIDSIKDIELDFAKSPERYTGYLKGQLTGKVIRDYNSKIALGNIESEYYVFKPSVVQQAVAFEHPSGAFIWFKADWDNTAPEADGYPKNAIFYQYVDSSGNKSDPQYVPIDFSAVSGATFWGLEMLAPYGFSSNIATVNIYLGQFSGSRTYKLFKSVPAKVGWAKMELDFGAASDAPVANTKFSKAEGAISYGESNSLFAYPFLNFESISQIAPITAMETILGPLWVWTDRSLDLTTLSVQRPRGEEETKYVGCIGFNANVKTSKVVFFMSAFGLYFAEASGVVAFPANVQQIIRQYLQEKIDGVPDLTNMARCSLGWLGRREELWVHLPSSKDIGGNLPNRLLIFRFFDGNVADWMNYEFDLTNYTDQTLYPEILRPVVLRGHSDGTMFSAHIQSQNSELMLLDNDRTEDDYKWLGPTILEKRYSLGLSGVRKILRSVDWRISGLSSMKITTGIIYTGVAIAIPDGTPDYKGGIYNACRTFDVNLIGNGGFQTLRHICNGHSAETTSYTPAVRWVTQPDDEGHNDITYYSVETLLELDGDHP